MKPKIIQKFWENSDILSPLEPLPHPLQFQYFLKNSNFLSIMTCLSRKTPPPVPSWNFPVSIPITESHTSVHKWSASIQSWKSKNKSFKMRFISYRKVSWCNLFHVLKWVFWLTSIYSIHQTWALHHWKLPLECQCKNCPQESAY